MIVGRLLTPQDALERLAYALVGPLEAGVENNELSARDFTRQPDTEPQYSVAEGLGALIARWGAKVPVKLATRVVRVDFDGNAGPGRDDQRRAQRPDGHRHRADRRAGGGVLRLRSAAQRRQARGDRPAADGALQQGGVVLLAQADRCAGRAQRVGTDAQGPGLRRHRGPYNRDAAVVFVGGAHARELEEQGGGAAASFALSAMAEIYGDELRGAVAHSHATRWGKDPFARGSWSMAIPGRAEARLVVASHTTTACSSPARRPIRCGPRASAAPTPPACAPPARRWRGWAANVRRWDGVAGVSNRWTFVSFLRNGATQTR